MAVNREWKLMALRDILSAREKEQSKYRIDREWAGYVKRFFFGDGDWFDLDCEQWHRRMERQELPLSLVHYYVEG